MNPVRVIICGSRGRMGQALIQQEDKIDPYLDTLFTTYLVRSLIIGLMLIVFARPLGNFFHLGDAYTVFWAIVPLPILQSLQSPRLVSLYRRLDFHFVTILNVSEVAASFVYGLLAVLYWRDWRRILTGLGRTLRHRTLAPADRDARLAWLLVVSTVPAGVLGLLLERQVRHLFVAPRAAGFFLVMNGVLLFGAERLRRQAQRAPEPSDPDRRIAGELSWW